MWSGSAGASTADTQKFCSSSVGIQIHQNDIGLPTTGATITATQFVAATATVGEYCRVDGAINPIDPAAPVIRFRVNLPTDWNGKALGFGGGGYNGNIPNTTGAPTLGNFPGVVLPLKRGYITYAGDSGHQSASSDDAEFALNDEALLNFGFMHVKKTRDVMVAIAKLRYGTAPQYIYFSGGSTGGREGLTGAMRWPQDFQGILTNYPTANFMGLRLWGAALAGAIYSNNSEGWIPPAMVDRIAAMANERCDGLDGVADGLVSNMIACRALHQELLKELACKNGETGFPAHCLTPAQIAKTIEVYHNGYTLPFSFVNGINTYPGYNSLEGITMQIGSQPEYITPTPPSGPNAHHVNRADQFMKFFVTRNPNFDLRTFDIQHPGVWEDRLIALSDVLGATNPDFEAFRRAGGKIIWVQGWDDPSVTPFANINVIKAIHAKMASRVESFLRFYVIPGLAHGGGKFSPVWDNLTALENWVEKGLPPVNQIMFDGTNTPTRGRSRPLCEYPGFPQYIGVGDPNVASSYTCATPQIVFKDPTPPVRKPPRLCSNPIWLQYHLSRNVNARPDFDCVNY
jgi:feruloyl esterase